MDKNKLMYFLKDRKFTVDTFCKSVKISKSGLYSKCYHNSFTLSDIDKIVRVLNLTVDEMVSIFFADYVSQKETGV